MTQPVPRLSVPAALALGSAALGAAFATGLFLADPGAAAGGFYDDLRAGPALGQPGAAHPGQEGAGPGHLHGLLRPGPGPGAARGRARGDLRGGRAAPGAGTAPVEAGRGGAQDRPPAEARLGDPGRAAGGGRGRHLRRGRGGCGQGELLRLLRALPAAAATRRHPRRPQSKGSTAGEEKAPCRARSPSLPLTPLIPQSPTQSSHVGYTPCGAPAPVPRLSSALVLSPALVTSRPGTSLRGPASRPDTSLRDPAFRLGTSLQDPASRPGTSLRVPRLPPEHLPPSPPPSARAPPSEAPPPTARLAPPSRRSYGAGRCCNLRKGTWRPSVCET
ncbi:catechol O-methyltransferase domain-containing protein 1 isoform X1 [Pan paniscus]|uniref:catechol O-methyltransferase domain-containing protein 1 isoform X1 n=1 Tax=Pan paniscus TaxID=9597 RepID=UPI003003EAE7